jgi:hypothetical protein
MSDLNVGSLTVSSLVFSNSGGTQTKAGATVLTDFANVSPTTPSSNQVLMWNATTSKWEPASMPGRLLSINTYNNDTGAAFARFQAGLTATWTKPTGCNSVLVYVTGGGGGARTNSNSYRGAGGGGGGTAIKYITNPTTTVAVTVGGGGNEAYNGGRGATGATSSFGSYCSASGGEGGMTDSPYEGGIGGSATGGDINIPGGGGTMAHDANREGGGGMSFWHQAGSNHHYTDSSRWFIMHGRYGSGGSAGYYSQNDSSYCRGGSGVVIVYNYS